MCLPQRVCCLRSSPLWRHPLHCFHSLNRCRRRDLCSVRSQILNNTVEGLAFKMHLVLYRFNNKYPRYGYDLDYCPEWYLQAWESGELIFCRRWSMQLFGQVPTQCLTPWRKSTSMQTKMLPLSARRGSEDHELKEQCSLNNSKVPTMLASN